MVFIIIAYIHIHIGCDDVTLCKLDPEANSLKKKPLQLNAKEIKINVLQQRENCKWRTTHFSKEVLTHRPQPNVCPFTISTPFLRYHFRLFWVEQASWVLYIFLCIQNILVPLKKHKEENPSTYCTNGETNSFCIHRVPCVHFIRIQFLHDFFHFTFLRVRFYYVQFVNVAISLKREKKPFFFLSQLILGWSEKNR